MKRYIKIIICTCALFSQSTVWAQDSSSGKLAIKLHANVGLNDPIKTEFSIPDVSHKSSSNEFGIDFGWTFWQHKNHRLELNAGLGYSASSLTLGMDNLSYDYAAPATADMDGDPYIRFYDLHDIEQKTELGRLTVPVYLSYAYRCNRWLTFHLDLGVSLGFKVSSKISDCSGTGYSYGIYPQYDNLRIEDSYLNEFGSKTFTSDNVSIPQANGFSCSFLAGLGAEFRIYGPISADLSVRYNGGLTNLYKPYITDMTEYTDQNSPVTYTVEDGEQMKSLTDYLKSSKLSQIGINISLIYRF